MALYPSCPKSERKAAKGGAGRGPRQGVRKESIYSLKWTGHSISGPREVQGKEDDSSYSVVDGLFVYSARRQCKGIPINFLFDVNSCLLFNLPCKDNEVITHTKT